MAEEETESCISGTTFGRKPGDPVEADENPYGKTKGSKKKQGIFRGLGSMFRFGRHRKSAGATSSAASAAAALHRQQQEEAIALARLHEELLENQHHQEQKSKQDHQRAKHQHQHSDYALPQGIHGGSGSYQVPQGYSYSQHPHMSQQGSGRVPVPQSSSSKSGRKSESSHRTDKDINGNTNNANHGRSTSVDVYNEMQRPGSRMGMVVVDPKKYTHYINYDEIRHHLK